MNSTAKKCMSTCTRLVSLVIPCLLLCLLTTSLSGCIVAAVGAAGAGAAAYGYYQGNSVASYGAEFGETYQATKKALADLAMPVRQESHQGSTGEIESSIEDGTHVTIKLEEKPRMQASDGHQTEVTIRVGYFGDSTISNNIQQKIMLHITQKQSQQASPSRLPPIGTTPPIQQTQAVSAPPPLTPANPASANPGWKPATPPGGAKVPPP